MVVQQRPDSHPPRVPRWGSSSEVMTGPIPLDWLLVAANLPGRTLHTGIALWHAAGLIGSFSIRLNNKACLPFGLERNTKNRALAELELAGLAKVERKRGEAPVVTILPERATP